MNFRAASITIILVFAVIGGTAAAKATKDIEEEREWPIAEFCNEDKCKLPDCRCQDALLPSEKFEGQESQIPQFIAITFDDAVTAVHYEYYQKLFSDVVNPDHCPARGTFFLSHEYTDYVKVNALYTDGHEIALHSITHGNGTDYWRNASEDLIMKEFSQQLEILEKFAKVNRKDIHGMRMPFLQLAGNKTFTVAKRMGLEYDSSWPTVSHRDGLWPYTLDYVTEQDCVIGPCPEVSVPGFWISPMVTWLDTHNFHCSMLDACHFQPDDDVDKLFEWILKNFNEHYKGKRAPFGMYMHAAWFTRGNIQFEALKKFVDYASTLPDVYIEPLHRIIQYMREPTLGKPFKGCPKLPKASCKKRSCTVRKVVDDELRYMTVCDRCPIVYPWLDNPLGKL